MLDFTLFSLGFRVRWSSQKSSEYHTVFSTEEEKMPFSPLRFFSVRGPLRQCSLVSWYQPRVEWRQLFWFLHEATPFPSVCPDKAGTSPKNIVHGIIPPLRQAVFRNTHTKKPSLPLQQQALLLDQTCLPLFSLGIISWAAPWSFMQIDFWRTCPTSLPDLLRHASNCNGRYTLDQNWDLLQKLEILKFREMNICILQIIFHKIVTFDRGQMADSSILYSIKRPWDADILCWQMKIDPYVWKPVEQVIILILFFRCLTRTLTSVEGCSTSAQRKAGGVPTSKDRIFPKELISVCDSPWTSGQLVSQSSIL